MSLAKTRVASFSMLADCLHLLEQQLPVSPTYGAVFHSCSHVTLTLTPLASMEVVMHEHVAGQRRSGRQERLRACPRTQTHSHVFVMTAAQSRRSVGRAGANYGRRLPKTCLPARPPDGAPICRPDFGDTQSRMRRQSGKKGPNTPGEFDWCHKTHCVMWHLDFK